MQRNLEMKVKVNSFKNLKQKLNSMRIGLDEILVQKDIYYKVKDGLLKLRIENNKSRLIYYKRNEKLEKRWSEFEYLTFSDGNVEKFLARFLKTEVVVSKVRELYMYKNTRIHLDRVRLLGAFLELESKVTSGLKDAEKRFNHLVNKLEINQSDQIRASYRDLLMKLKK